MNIETELLDTQTEDQEGEAPEAEALTPEEIADLKKRADVSSQNYERLKRAEAEKAELKRQLEEAQLGQDSFITEDDTAKRLRELDAKLARIEEKTQLDSIYSQYPSIKDKSAEFDEFRQEYHGVALDKVAKLFAVEKDMLDESPARKGLEKARGGKRTPPTQGNTSEDIARLRTTNYREYIKQIKAGKI